jgi:hypothetical protein
MTISMLDTQFYYRNPARGGMIDIRTAPSTQYAVTVPAGWSEEDKIARPLYNNWAAANATQNGNGFIGQLGISRQNAIQNVRTVAQVAAVVTGAAIVSTASPVLSTSVMPVLSTSTNSALAYAQGVGANALQQGALAGSVAALSGGSIKDAAVSSASNSVKSTVTADLSAVATVQGNKLLDSLSNLSPSSTLNLTGGFMSAITDLRDAIVGNIKTAVVAAIAPPTISNSVATLTAPALSSPSTPTTDNSGTKTTTDNTMMYAFIALGSVAIYFVAKGK